MQTRRSPHPSDDPAAQAPRGLGERIVDELAALGLKPSVYLERGGRLRCEAARTYPQVFDGIPPTAGVIGRTFATGCETRVDEPGDDAAFIQITAGIRAQLCVPLHVEGRCVGVVNVESTRALSEADTDAVRAAGGRLEEHLAAIGGPPRETAAQRLLASVGRLAKAPTPDALTAEILRAAVDVSDLDSAAIVAVDDAGAAHVVQAVGPLSDVLRATPVADLADAVTYVHAGCSCVTTDDGTPELLGTARRGGLGSAALMTLTTAPFRMLVCAGEGSGAISTETVELLELLCAQAQATWRTAELLVDLRHRATIDPLTGLLHHGAFHARLDSGDVGAVVMIDVDRFKAHNDLHGHYAGDTLLRGIAGALGENAPEGCAVFRIGGDEFAAVFDPGGDPGGYADAVTRTLIRLGGPTVSFGIATHREGDTAAETSRRADYALYAAKGAGRGRAMVAGSRSWSRS